MFGFSSYSESPFSALPLNNYELSCAAGSYSITGGFATLSYVKTVVANAGSYSITGNAADFRYDQVLQGNAGSYTLTGADAGFSYNQVLIAEGGSFAITGNSATFAYNQVIYAGAFNYLWTGNNVALLQSKIINGSAGVYALTGNDASFVKGNAFVVGSGSYAFTGQNADLTYTPIPVVIVESKGGLPKTKRKTKIDTDREQRKELEAIVKREFDILDGTYVPEAVEMVKEVFIPKIKQIDLNEYNLAIAQVNALLLQAKIQAAEYEAELDDEEAILMLL